MEESTTDIIGIFAAVALMFLVPLVLLADRNDDISQLVVSNATAAFVDNIIKTGTMTAEDYIKYQDQLTQTGNVYDISIEIKVLDKNYGINKVYSIYDNNNITKEILYYIANNTKNIYVPVTK